MRGAMMVVAGLLATGASAAEAGASEQAAQVSEVGKRGTFVGLSVLPLGSGSLALEAERAMGERFSVRVGLRVGASWMGREFDGTDMRSRDFSVGAEPGLRYFLTGSAPRGLWVGPNLELGRTWGSTTIPVGNGGVASEVELGSRSWSVGAAALVGYSMVLSEGLTVQAGVGFGAIRAWERTERFGVLVGTLSTRAAQQQPRTEEVRSTAWRIGERLSLAVGWSF